jgi:hypothetical protein
VVCGDWMVVCAVRYEPVSDPKFPATGTQNRGNPLFSAFFSQNG